MGLVPKCSLFVLDMLQCFTVYFNCRSAKESNMAGKSYRSAKTGQFVTPKFAKTHTATTLGEKRGGGETGSARSAKTGQFVSDKFAKTHPTTTAKEK